MTPQASGRGTRSPATADARLHGVDTNEVAEFDQFRALSFDCYGTLIDWEAGIVAALEPWSSRAAIAAADDELLEAFAAHETVVERERPTMPYPEVLAETLRRIATEYGADATDDERAAFGASVGDWPAFPDSADALRRLHTRFELVILSNVDRASFAGSNERLGVTFDRIVTAEEVGSYKPDPANFDALVAAVGARGIGRTELLHLAQSLYHDHAPAHAAGLPSVWIDRRRGRRGSGATPLPAGTVQPRWTFASLAEFADAAVGRRTSGH